MPNAACSSVKMRTKNRLLKVVVGIGLIGRHSETGRMGGNEINYYLEEFF